MGRQSSRAALRNKEDLRLQSQCDERDGMGEGKKCSLIGPQAEQSWSSVRLKEIF